MSEIKIEKVTVRRGTDHITIKYVEDGQAKTLIISAREVVQNWEAVKRFENSVGKPHDHLHAWSEFDYICAGCGELVKGSKGNML